MWSAERRRRGFTLIEVMAAVAVLAIVFTTIAQMAMDSLAKEGESTRRLHASLLADDQLDQLEAQLAVQPPPLGTAEQELDDFTVVTDVRPFDLTGPVLDQALKTATAHGRLQPEEKVGPDTTPPYALLTTPPGSTTPTLLEIVVHVRWTEGYNEQEVTRTTYAADPTVVDAAVGAAGGNDASGDGSGDDGSGTGNGQEGGGTTGSGASQKPKASQQHSFEQGKGLE